MDEQHCERVIASAFDWSDEDCELQWAIDLWYAALAELMSERAPA